MEVNGEVTILLIKETIEYLMSVTEPSHANTIWKRKPIGLLTCASSDQLS